MLELLALLASFLVSWILTSVASRYASVIGRLDVPNSRSAHVLPVPRGGGLPFALILTLSFNISTEVGDFTFFNALLIVISAVTIAAVGYIDDRADLSPISRLVVHTVVAGVTVAALDNQFDVYVYHSEFVRWILLIIGVVLVVWSINLFNFMDGIDGLAASQAIFVAGASWLLLNESASNFDLWSLMCLLTVGSVSGFLVLNWPPAKIFMGDVGSGFLGYWLALIAIGMHFNNALSIWTSLILSSVFLADTGVTLMRRVINGARWYQAHSLHAYQRRAREFKSQLKVTGIVCLFNLGVVLPVAYLSIMKPTFAAWLTVGWLLLLGGGCFILGAGKSDI
jgi:Fuc2NAc and GlcNAc transferase